MFALRNSVLKKAVWSCRPRSGCVQCIYELSNHFCTKLDDLSVNSNPVHDMRMPKTSGSVPPIELDPSNCNTQDAITNELKGNDTRPDSFIEMNIDRSELGGGYESLLKENDEELTEDQMKKFKEPLTPLAKELIIYIKNRGPLSMNEFMTQALTHNLHGYYQNKINENKIGSGGDFITSPEISPLFGEMVAIWCVNMWENMGKPEAFNLIEMGPGNGTLMKGILDATKSKFPEFAKAAQVCLIEISDEMRKLQYDKLDCVDIETVEAKGNNDAGVGGERKGKDNVPKKQGYMQRRTPEQTFSSTASHLMDEKPDQLDPKSPPYLIVNAITRDNTHRISWYKQLYQVYDEKQSSPSVPMLIIGQEFLDAFPIYQFGNVSTDLAQLGEWREKLIDVDNSTTSPYHFRCVLASKATPASSLMLGGESRIEDTAGRSIADTIISDKSLLYGLLNIPAPPNPTSDGDTSTLNVNQENQEHKETGTECGVEVSPMALGMCESVAKYISIHGGAALFVDYGENHTQSDSLRGYYKHKQVNFLSMPGNVDITADVDFYACKSVVQRQQEALINGEPTVDENDVLLSVLEQDKLRLKKRKQRLNGEVVEKPKKQVLVSNIITQYEFLMHMGIIPRTEQIINSDISDEEANLVVQNMKKIVSLDEMGGRFKVMCISNSDIVTNKPHEVGEDNSIVCSHMPAFSNFS